jgi:hypothetical protein
MVYLWIPEVELLKLQKNGQFPDEPFFVVYYKSKARATESI